MQPQSYEVRPSRRSGRIYGFVAVVLLVLAALAASRGDDGTVLAMGALGLGFAVWAVVRELREPYRVVLDDEGVSFVARSHRRTLPWPELAGVTFQSDNRGGRLVWVFADEGGLVMPAAVPDLHHLLVEVERRAPHAQVVT